MLKPMDNISIPGPCGDLEVCFERPSENQLLQGVMIILHPNPLYGGTNQNKVVQTTLKASVNQGYVVYAPNLRGVGNSEGQHNFGKGEVDDVLSVINCAQERHPELSISIAGFSFGGFIAIKCTQLFAFEKIILLGAAIGKYEEPEPELPENISCLIVHAEKDEVIPIKQVFDWARTQSLPITVILDASHFFHGKLIVLQHVIEEFLK